MIWLLQTVDVTMTVAVDATMVADAAMEPAFLEAAPATVSSGSSS